VRISFLILTLCAFNGLCQSYSVTNPPLLPDKNLTPGDTLTNGDAIEEICSKGFAHTVRNVPESEKREVFIRYFGTVPKNAGQFEIDHLISCELNGAQTVNNLWPESYVSQPFNAHVKDKLEDRLAALVRQDLKKNGHASATKLLAQFQTEISENWTNAYHKYVSPKP
jgi:hypothetical protein